MTKGAAEPPPRDPNLLALQAAVGSLRESARDMELHHAALDDLERLAEFTEAELRDRAEEIAAIRRLADRLEGEALALLRRRRPAPERPDRR